MIQDDSWTDMYLNPDDLVYESDNVSLSRRDWHLVRFDEMTHRYCIPFWEIDELGRGGVAIYEKIEDRLKKIV